jgi:hypothetical protein
MTPNRVYKKLCKNLQKRDASQGIPDGKNVSGHLFLFLSVSFLLPSSFAFPYLFLFSSYYGGLGSSVDIATGYGMGGPGIKKKKSQSGRNFSHTSRPALEPTQPPVQWVPGLSRG